MIPTLVLVYDNSSTLSSIEKEVIEQKLMRVVRLNSKVGISLYSNSNQTPFVEGALIFNQLGDRIATRRDDYRDLLNIVKQEYKNCNTHNKELLEQWYRDFKIKESSNDTQV